MKKNIFIPVLLALIAVNGIGILLKVLELPAFIILLGFRFHLSLVLPILFIFTRVRSLLINEFTNPGFKKNYPYVISLFLLPLLILAGLYYFEYLDIGDPDFFYEFGMSSLLDLPVYLVWNIPQLILFYLFLSFTADHTKYKFPVIFLLSFIPFLFEFIPAGDAEINLYSLLSLMLITLMNAALITKFRNIYWFTVFNFLLLWLPILIFGSESETLIKIIFASQYIRWEGFLEVDKIITEYSIAGFLLSVLIMLFFITFIKKDKMVY